MTTKAELLRTIRKHCLNCCSNSSQVVEKCTSGPDAEPYAVCALWVYRSGKDPTPSPLKVEQGRATGEKYGYGKKT